MTTVAHVVPFVGVAVLLVVLEPLAVPVSLVALAQAWIIPELYAQRGSNVVRSRSRGGGAPERRALGLLGDLVEDDACVYFGGPVEPAAVTVLAEFEDPDFAAAVVLGDIGFVRADAELDELPAATRRARVFAGYCGWAPGQLEAELDGDDSWIVEAPEPDDVFAEDTRDLWSDVLKRKGGQFAIVALMPYDPSVN